MASTHERSAEKAPPHEIPGISFGIYRPRNTITNQMIEDWCVTTPGGKPLTADDILKRTGVETRRVAQDWETPRYMGLAAARGALGFSKDADALFVSTSYPTGENLAQEITRTLKLDIADDAQLNVHAACSGFTRGLTHIAEHEEDFLGKRVLFVATERYSPTLEDLHNGVQNDPSLAQTIFSDGAVAMEFTYGEDLKILSYVDFAFPEEVSNCLRMPIDESLIQQPAIVVHVPESTSGKFEQEGAKVLRTVARTIPPIIEEVIAAAELPAGTVKVIVAHQGSRHITEGLQDRIEDQTLVRDFQEGNWSSASVPKALMKAIQDGTIQTGDTVVLAGFGAGLFASIAVVQFGERHQKEEGR